jgi:hypothetical protein
MRIQIMPLPAELVDDRLQEPFAIVVDQFEYPIDGSVTARWQQFKEQCGARAVLIDPGTVEVVDQYADDDPVTDQHIDRFADEVARRLARQARGVTSGWLSIPPDPLDNQEQHAPHHPPAPTEETHP